MHSAKSPCRSQFQKHAKQRSYYRPRSGLWTPDTRARFHLIRGYKETTQNYQVNVRTYNFRRLDKASDRRPRIIYVHGRYQTDERATGSVTSIKPVKRIPERYTALRIPLWFNEHLGGGGGKKALANLWNSLDCNLNYFDTKGKHERRRRQ